VVVSYLDWHCNFSDDEISAAIAAGYFNAHAAIVAGTVPARPFRFRCMPPWHRDNRDDGRSGRDAG
jgi:hypothetical protein